MFDALIALSSAAATISSAIGVCGFGIYQFKKQKKYEFRLEVAKTLFQRKWVLVHTNKPNAASYSEFNCALGAVQLAFADHGKIPGLLSDFASAVGDDKTKILSSILVEVAAAVGLKVSLDKVGACLALPLPDETPTTYIYVPVTPFQ